jgi:hypothetical protein
MRNVSSRRVIPFALLIIAWLLVFESPAAASSIRDANDVRGRLDIRFVGAKNNTVGGFVKFRLDTQWGYDCPFLRSGSPNRVFIFFDAGRDGDIDARGRLMCSGDAWFVQMEDTRFFGHHPDRNTTVVPMGWEGIPGDQARGDGSIIVKTLDASSRRCSTPCIDRAPNTGSLVVW